jgi:CheY-like chemotaxis protein
VISTQKVIRQFCRLVLADRLFGDEVAAAVAPESEDDGSTPESRVKAFRRLFKTWSEAYATGDENEPFSDRYLLASAGEPPGKTLSAVLLNDVLELPSAEVDQILAPSKNSSTELVVTGRVMHAAQATGSIVIIEDEPLIASDLRDIVEKMGVDVLAVTGSGEKAIELIKKKKPDLVLTDYHLTGAMNGLDVIRGCRDVHDCAVVFVTGFPETVLEGEDGEPDVVIGKPYTMVAIRAAVAQCLKIGRRSVIE